MGKLYDMAVAIQKAIERSGKDPAKARGMIGLKSSVLLSLVRPDTPDDPAKIEKLRAAAEDVLGVAI